MLQIGWIGTGVMGNSMASHIQKLGELKYVYNRTENKTYELIQKGALFLSPKEMTLKADIIFTMIGTPDDVREMYLGDEGIIAHGRKGQIFIDMTTTQPSLVVEIYSACSKKGISFLDAPVSGGDVGAKNGTLAIMVGGDVQVFNTVLPYFEVMGKNIVLEGPVGSGQHTKMCNQIAIAGSMIGMCESLIYAMKSGLDEQKVIDIISKGAAGSWSLDNLAPRVLRGELDTGFFVKHFVKDMGIALQEAKNMKIVLPGLALVHQLYTSIIAYGGENLGTQSLIMALKRLSNIS